MKWNQELKAELIEDLKQAQEEIQSIGEKGLSMAWNAQDEAWGILTSWIARLEKIIAQED